MIRILFSGILGIFLLAIQSTFLTLEPFQRVKPDLLMILVLYLGFFSPPISGGISAFFLGFLTDLFSGNSYGLFSLTRLIIFYGAQFIRNRFYFEDQLYKFLYAFFFTLFEGLLVILILNIFSIVNMEMLFKFFLKFIFPQSFFTALLSPLGFYIFSRINILFVTRRVANSSGGFSQ